MLRWPPNGSDHRRRGAPSEPEGYLPYAHSRPGKPREGVVRVVEPRPSGWWPAYQADGGPGSARSAVGGADRQSRRSLAMGKILEHTSYKSPAVGQASSSLSLPPIVLLRTEVALDVPGPATLGHSEDASAAVVSAMALRRDSSAADQRWPRHMRNRPGPFPRRPPPCRIGQGGRASRPGVFP
jgi:hypothetical protein